MEPYKTIYGNNCIITQYADRMEVLWNSDEGLLLQRKVTYFYRDIFVAEYRRPLSLTLGYIRFIASENIVKDRIFNSSKKDKSGYIVIPLKSYTNDDHNAYLNLYQNIKNSSNTW